MDTRLLENAESILPEGELIERLNANTPLRIKAGFDPTGSDLHLGHLVLLRQLRAFQERGHTVLLVVGDATAAIGDPSGRNVTRPALDATTIQENAELYQSQAFKVLDAKKTEVVYNSTWMHKLDFDAIIKLIAPHTVAQLLERDDFATRFKEGLPIALHELIYPIMQGYDSYMLDADLELGGTDQTFNLLMGRHVQKLYNKKPQCTLTLPILEGTDGVQKMSKSLDNYIGFNDNASIMFAKIMSVSDALMWRYLALISTTPKATIATLKDAVSKGQNPKDIKVNLAKEIVDLLKGSGEGDKAEEAFFRQFKEHKPPENIPETTLSAGKNWLIGEALVQAGLAGSNSEAMRMIKQGAVKVDGEKVHDGKTVLPSNKAQLCQVGKRKFARITIK